MAVRDVPHVTFKVTVKLGRPAFSEMSCFSWVDTGLLTRPLPLTTASACATPARCAPIATALTSSLTNYHSYHYISLGTRRRSIGSGAPTTTRKTSTASTSPSNQQSTNESFPSSKRAMVTLSSIRESRVASRRLPKIVINQKCLTSPLSSPSTGATSPSSNSSPISCSTLPIFDNGCKSYLKHTKASLMKTPARPKIGS